MRIHLGIEKQIPRKMLLLIRAFLICTFIFAARSGYSQECEITTPVRVVDKDAHPLAKLTADQLRASIGGVSAQVVGVTPGDRPGMVLLIDASGSMKSSWTESINAAKELANRTEHIAVVVFREGLLVHANGHSETHKLLDELSAKTDNWGGTPLYDALIEIAGGVGRQNVVLVVISDGEDNLSQHSSEETEALFLRSSWSPVFGLLVNYDHDKPQRGNFKKIVAATGGLIARPSSASKVMEAANVLAGEIGTVFNVTLQSKQLGRTMRKLKLDVIGEDKKTRHDIHIAHVAELPGCHSISTP